MQAFYYRTPKVAASGFSRQQIPFSAKSGMYWRQINPGLLWEQELNLRSSHCSFPIKKGVLRNFVNFTEKHLYWSLFLIELQAKRLKHRWFSCGVYEILKTEIYERFFLKLVVLPGVSFLISYTCGSNRYMVFVS